MRRVKSSQRPQNKEDEDKVAPKCAQCVYSCKQRNPVTKVIACPYFKKEK